MEGKIDMAARRQVTNKLRTQCCKASKTDKSEILDRVVATTGMGRSTARRMLTGPRLLDPAEQVDGRTLPVGGRQAWHRCATDATESGTQGTSRCRSASRSSCVNERSARSV